MIYVNARFLGQPITGVQRYARELLRELGKLRSDLVLIAPCSCNVPTWEGYEVLLVGSHAGHFWEQLDLPRFLRSRNSSLLINLGSTAPIFYKNQIVVHHDITYVRHPESFPLKFRLLYRFLAPFFLRNSKAVLTSSKFSQREIAGFYKLKTDRFHVVPCAVDGEVFFADLNARSETKKPYFLAVSSIAPHKNFARLIEAFDLIRRDDVELHIVGGNSIFGNSTELTKNPNIKFWGRVNDGELVRMYQGAVAFVFPSLYEGFGIPPLEAQSCGCLVVASRHEAIQEVLAGSAIYFDPHNVTDIAEKLTSVLTKLEAVSEKIEMGFANAGRFSWADSARALNQIIDGIK